MRFCKITAFDSGIKGIQLGWSVAGPPLMAVYCYIFDDVMMDTGQSHMKKEVMEIARKNGIKRIFLTHHHEDHSGNAAALAEMLRARVYGHELTRKKLKTPYPILPYQKYIWGRSTPVDVEVFPGETDTALGRMTALHTPGHSRDHTVFFLPDQGIVFSGDLYLGDQIKFFRSDEDIISQINSLEKVLALDFDTLLCAHNPRQQDGRVHIRSKLNFLKDLHGGIVELWQRGLPEKHIFRQLKLKEDYFIKYFCFGNVSMLNGVRSVIKNKTNSATS